MDEKRRHTRVRFDHEAIFDHFRPTAKIGIFMGDRVIIPKSQKGLQAENARRRTMRKVVTDEEGVLALEKYHGFLHANFPCPVDETGADVEEKLSQTGRRRRKKNAGIPVGSEEVFFSIDQ
jgi:hypothetical protein